MSRRILACTLLAAALSLSAHADDQKDQHAHLPAPPTNAGLDKMKTLVGTWVAADEDGQPTDQVVSVIKLTAGGSAVHETIFPGHPHEMISLYTADGPDVLLTHYCVLGNQPQMKAAAKSPANQLVFEFAGGSNLDPKKDMHMHSATLTFIDADRIKLEAVGWENGAPAEEMCHAMTLVRKK